MCYTARGFEELRIGVFKLEGSKSRSGTTLTITYSNLVKELMNTFR